MADKHFSKIFHKLQNRACKLLSTLTSGPYRALYWTAYCQSTLYYFSSCFDLSKTRLKKVYRLQQKVIIGRPWIQGHHLADVFSVFKIGPCCNLVSSLQRAKIAMCLRYYGLQRICNAPSSHSILCSAKKVLLDWQHTDPDAFQQVVALHIPSSLPEDLQDRPTGQAPETRLKRKNVYKFITRPKLSQKQHNNEKAKNYVITKIRATPCAMFTDAILNGLLQLLETAQTKEISRVDRAYVLRWFLGEEADWNWHLRIHKTKRTSVCYCGCSALTN